MSPKLYEITSEIKALEPYIDKDNWMDDEQALVQQQLDSLQIELSDKCYGIVRVIKNLESDIDALKEEEEFLAQKRKSAEKKLKWLKEYTKNALQMADIDKIKAGVYRLSISDSKPSVVVSCSISDLPNKYRTVKIEETPDKDALRHAIEVGETINGVSLVHNKTLRIT